MSNQEILSQKDTFDTHSIIVQKFLMENEGVPHHDIKAATKWLKDYSQQFREIAEEIYTSENIEDAKIREEILSDDENKWRDAAKEMEKLFKVHA